jgi:hypothetical protein
VPITFAAKPSVYSIRVEDHKTETLADLSGIETTGNYGWSAVSSGGWLAMTPDGSPLILRNVTLSEIYALDFEAP